MSLVQRAKDSMLRRVLSALPVDPSAMWRELEPAHRAGFAAVLELAGDAEQLGPPAAPDELRAQLEAAATEFHLPPVLLEAVAWEMSQYDIAAPGGLMGLGAAADQPRGCAFLLRRLSDELGMARALRQYCAGDAVQAGRCAGSMLLLAARHIDAGGLDNVRGVLELLEQ